MVTQLPVPIRFELPDGWQQAPPDGVGAPGAAFVALNAATRDSGFTANIAIDGEFGDGGLTRMAEESVRALSRSTRAVAVVDRREIGSAEAPGLTQDLRITADAGGVVRELVQCQVYLVMGRSPDRGRSAVVRAVLTCTEHQVASVLDDFRSFVGTLAPEAPAW